MGLCRMASVNYSSRDGQIPSIRLQLGLHLPLLLALHSLSSFELISCGYLALLSSHCVSCCFAPFVDWLFILNSHAFSVCTKTRLSSLGASPPRMDDSSSVCDTLAYNCLRLGECECILTACAGLECSNRASLK